MTTSVWRYQDFGIAMLGGQACVWVVGKHLNPFQRRQKFDAHLVVGFIAHEDSHSSNLPS
jgi:hypothetical protein